eukprot:14211277-Ditylum_brightwellii.AAC.1
MSQQQHIIPLYHYNIYPPMPMWQLPLHDATNTYQHQRGPQHQGGTCYKHGGGAKCKCQQQQQQCQQQCQQQYQQQNQPITNKNPVHGYQNKATFQNKMGVNTNN